MNLLIKSATILDPGSPFHHQIADILIEKEVIFKDDLETIFGSRPFEKSGHEVITEA